MPTSSRSLENRTPKTAKGRSQGHASCLCGLAPEDLKRIEAAAKASKQTVSAWVRSTLSAAIGGISLWISN